MARFYIAVPIADARIALETLFSAATAAELLPALKPASIAGMVIVPVRAPWMRAKDQSRSRRRMDEWAGILRVGIAYRNGLSGVPMPEPSMPPVNVRVLREC